MYEHGLGEGRRCPQSPHAAKHSDQNKDALRFSLIQRHTRRSRPLKHALENGRKSGALEKRESTGPSSARARFAILRMRRSESRMRCGARVERGALFWEGSVLFFEWCRFLPLAALGGGFLPTFYLDLFRFIACRPSSNPSRRERKFLPSNLAEPRGFWGWGSRRKRFGSCCGGLRVVHRCVVCWGCCFLGRLLACTGCHFQKPVFVAVLFSLSFEHFNP